MNLAHVVPWGRSLHEYQLMFSLTEADLMKRVLGCGDGPASVNAEMSERVASQYISVDPIYTFTGPEIESRVNETYEQIVGQVKQNVDRYLWNHFPDPDAQGRARLAAMKHFLADYEAGKRSGRYIPGSLPNLPFPDDTFDLSLCSHLVFLYSKQLDLEFHISAMLEQLRVAKEVRVFPLFDLDCQKSSHLEPVMQALTERGYQAELQKVAHEFQKGANEMLRVQRKGQIPTPAVSLPTW